MVLNTLGAFFMFVLTIMELRFHMHYRRVRKVVYTRYNEYIYTCIKYVLFCLTKLEN